MPAHATHAAGGMDLALRNAPKQVFELIGDPRTGVADDVTKNPFGETTVDMVWHQLSNEVSSSGLLVVESLVESLLESLGQRCVPVCSREKPPWSIRPTMNTAAVKLLHHSAASSRCAGLAIAAAMRSKTACCHTQLTPTCTAGGCLPVPPCCLHACWDACKARQHPCVLLL